jgi:hypothetical protein
MLSIYIARSRSNCRADAHFGADFVRQVPPSPSPPIYWNHQVAAKILFDLWAATSYGQNLEPQGLSLGSS